MLYSQTSLKFCLMKIFLQLFFRIQWLLNNVNLENALFILLQNIQFYSLTPNEFLSSRPSDLKKISIDFQLSDWSKIKNIELDDHVFMSFRGFLVQMPANVRGDSSPADGFVSKTSLLYFFSSSGIRINKKTWKERRKVKLSKIKLMSVFYGLLANKKN